MKSLFKSLFLISLIIVLGTLFLCFLPSQETLDNEPTIQQLAEPETRELYKTIDVVITDVKCTWRSNREAFYSVKYKTDEYGLEETDSQISNWTSFGYKLERKELDVGSVVQATLWSTVQGDKVLGRRLGTLEK